MNNLFLNLVNLMQSKIISVEEAEPEIYKEEVIPLSYLPSVSVDENDIVFSSYLNNRVQTYYSGTIFQPSIIQYEVGNYEGFIRCKYCEGKNNTIRTKCEHCGAPL